MAAKKLTAYDLKRRKVRNALWKYASEVIYDRHDEKGFCTVPRSLALVSTLLRHLSKDDPSRVYVDLWMRQRDDGFIEVDDGDEAAYTSGLTGTRARKSWRSKIEELKRLGFLQYAAKGTQKYRYILLIHPHAVVLRLREEQHSKVPEIWWDYYGTRMAEVGVHVAAPKLRTILETLDGAATNGTDP
jgi:hypothetical protein